MNYKALILCLAVISCDAYSKESVSARPISSSKKSRTLKITRTQALRIAASAGKILASIGLISWNFVGNIDHERNVQAITDLHVGIQHLQTPGYIFCSWWFLFSSVAAAIILAKQGITEIYETLKDPEDIALFSKIMEYHGFDASLIHQTIESNRQHQEKIINDIFSLLAPGQQHIVTILGLSFKADTNDIRNSPAISIIRALQEKEIVIKAYDARALFGMQQLFPSIHYFDSPYEAIKNTDLIIILTDCETIKNLDLEKISHLCKTKALIDTRNIYNPDSLKKYGFNFINMGLQ